MKWEEIFLVDICRPKQWPTISMKEMTESGYPVYGANGAIGFYNKFTHEQPTVLITCRGATCGTINISEPFSYVNGNAMALDNLDTHRVDRKFLHYLLRRRGLSDAITGSAQPQITGESLRKIKVSLPPLPEQRRVAAILDKADSLREKRRQAIVKLDELLKSVFIEMFGDPVTNPKGWERRSLDEVVENIDSGWSPVCLDRPAEDREWGVLKLGAVTSCKYLEFENKALPEGLEPDPSLEVKPGDLLFSRKNTYELVAACAFVLSTRPKLMLSDLIFRFRLKNDCGFVPEFLWALLTHPGKRKQVQTLASGSAGSMPNISKSRLLKFLVERPPSELQQDFALRMRAIQKLSEDFIKSSRLLDNNFNSLQQRAFSGELFTEKTISIPLLTEVAQHV